jgi:hypothetical protein
MLKTCFKSFICLQKHVANVSFDFLEVNQVLHLSSRFLLPRLGVSSSWHWLGIRHPLSFSMLTFGVARAMRGHVK